MEKLLGVEQAAEALGVSKWTIRAWINQGRLISAKLGSRRLVPQSEVERVIAEAILPKATVSTESSK